MSAELLAIILGNSQKARLEMTKNIVSSFDDMEKRDLFLNAMLDISAPFIKHHKMSVSEKLIHACPISDCDHDTKYYHACERCRSSLCSYCFADEYCIACQQIRSGYCVNCSKEPFSSFHTCKNIECNVCDDHNEIQITCYVCCKNFHNCKHSITQYDMFCVCGDCWHLWY